MNYRLIRSTKNASQRTKLILPLCIFGLVVAFHLLFPDILPSAAAYIARPLWRLEEAALDAARGMLGFFSSRDTLMSEVLRLEEELQEKEIELLDRTALALENRELIETFGRSPARKGILAAVLTSPPRSLYDTVVLDAGRREGVSEGSLVLVGPVALGAIVRVASHTSVAELYSTAGVKTPMLVRRESISIPIQAIGMGGGAFTSVLPKETSVFEGDSVFMPGLVPILFGTVDSIESTPTGSFQTLYISSPVNITSLRFVEIRTAETE